MTDKQDIVERLRWSAASTEVDPMFEPYGKLLNEAAERIQTLEADKAALERERDALKKIANAIFNPYSTTEQALREGIEEYILARQPKEPT